MAYLAAVAVPRGKRTVRARPEHGVMRNRLHDIMAIHATVLCMADAARGIILHGKPAMPFGPCHIMTGRRNPWIHIYMASDTLLPRRMGFLAYSQHIATLQHRHSVQIFVQQVFMAVRALTCKGFSVYENIPGRYFVYLVRGIRFFGFRQRKNSQLFFLMAHSAGFSGNLFRLRLVMAVEAGFVRNGAERGLSRFTVAFIATHFIFGYMKIVTEAQLVFLFFLASGQQDKEYSHRRELDYAIHFHSRTSNDVRIR